MQNSIDGRGEAAWSFLTQRLTRTSKTFGDVLRYWNALRVGTDLPARSDLDPRVIQTPWPTPSFWTERVPAPFGFVSLAVI